MSSNVDHLPAQQPSRDLYVAIMMLYAAYADLEYSPSEREHIAGKTSPEVLLQAERIFDASTETSVLQWLIDQRPGVFPGSEGREVVIELIEELFRIDGEFSQIEQSSLGFLRRLL
ncbi:MAG: hypothetical protein AAFQ02_03050 [Bacteroidota bacterium]